MMRRQKTVEVEGEKVVVQELTVEEVGMILPLLEDLARRDELDEAAVMELIGRHFDAVKGVLARCVDADLGQIGMGRMVPILKAFWEVNSDFFAQVAGGLGPGR
jgi:predicted amidohydrolase